MVSGFCLIKEGSWQGTFIKKGRGKSPSLSPLIFKYYKSNKYQRNYIFLNDNFNFEDNYANISIK